ncbi:hypothetical protein [Micromonospora sagamiensis]|uniref:Uncharacterized protein n=1 Tax=Micromonospora sagamiensis TaxID=47875 RepID=A0A562WCX8_9ACTN|nr:hypothetical protein [Micromonospora sagamiensis]TWJ28122.1 hypothetical protein JD81_01625 [Micromonospora sagamiensis]BCL12989.1 hypothetical protein GCM10017556_07280 [Micromonospora sagamiensis]
MQPHPTVRAVQDARDATTARDGSGGLAPLGHPALPRMTAGIPAGVA